LVPRGRIDLSDEKPPVRGTGREAHVSWDDQELIRPDVHVERELHPAVVEVNAAAETETETETDETSS